MKTMWRKVGRLFIIKTRLEAWLIIYAIAVGSIERGQHYLGQYPGWGGIMLALACTGVVFVAGAKLLDSVRAPVPALAASKQAQRARRLVIGRNRPRRQPRDRASERRISRRRD